MNKILIIIHREFTTRVRKRSFLILTILIPIILTLCYTFIMWMIMKDDSQKRDILVVNESMIDNPFVQVNETKFYNYDSLMTEDESVGYLMKHPEIYALILIPKDVMETSEISFYSLSQVPMELKYNISSQISTRIEDIKKDSLFCKIGIPDLEQQLASIKTNVNIKTLKVSETTGEVKKGSSEISSLIGIIAGFVIYIFIFMYAGQVMKGVIEEKTNRIVEVIVSSVKPFQFLMGKIIGVATVGLFQFVIWIVFGFLLLTIGQIILMSEIDIQAIQNSGISNMPGNIDTGLYAGNPELNAINEIMESIDLNFIIGFAGLFIYYFLGGYLLYASLFAAIGSAVDNETDSQQFLAPLSIILMLAVYIGLSAMKSPESSLVVWSSMIPFTSPVVMLVRYPFGVPTWELITSMLILFVSFIFFTCLSAKIYRVGILMYGKKPTWKELYKWLKY